MTEELTWPTEPSAIMIMGKLQGTKQENLQLHGRIAMAAALWYAAPQPKPYLIFAAFDKSNGVFDVDTVKSRLTELYQIPPDYLILRCKSNCTLIEVRVAKAIQRVYKLAHLFAITHLYHAGRTQHYFDEVLAELVSVLPAHVDIFDELVVPLGADELFANLRATIAASQPTRLDNSRELATEWILSHLHNFDKRGRIERTLAKLLRGSP